MKKRKNSSNKKFGLCPNFGAKLISVFWPNKNLCEGEMFAARFADFAAKFDRLEAEFAASLGENPGTETVATAPQLSEKCTEMIGKLRKWKNIFDTQTEAAGPKPRQWRMMIRDPNVAPPREPNLSDKFGIVLYNRMIPFGAYVPRTASDQNTGSNVWASHGRLETFALTSPGIPPECKKEQCRGRCMCIHMSKEVFGRDSRLQQLAILSATALSVVGKIRSLLATVPLTNEEIDFLSLDSRSDFPPPTIKRSPLNFHQTINVNLTGSQTPSTVQPPSPPLGSPTMSSPPMGPPHARPNSLGINSGNNNPGNKSSSMSPVILQVAQ
jgi:hypothetical protein